MLTSAKLVDALLDEETPKEFFKRRNSGGIEARFTVKEVSRVGREPVIEIRTRPGEIYVADVFIDKLMPVTGTWKFARHADRLGPYMCGHGPSKEAAILVAMKAYEVWRTKHKLRESETPKEFFKRKATEPPSGYVFKPCAKDDGTLDVYAAIPPRATFYLGNIKSINSPVNKWAATEVDRMGVKREWMWSQSKEALIKELHQNKMDEFSKAVEFERSRKFSESETPKEFFRRRNTSSAYQIRSADPGWLKIQVPSPLQSGNRVYWSMLRVGSSPTDTINKLRERIEHLVKERKGYKLGDMFWSEHYGSFRVEEGGIVKRVGA